MDPIDPNAKQIQVCVMSLFSFFGRRQTREDSYLLLFTGRHSSSSRHKTSSRQRNEGKENGGYLSETEELGCVSKNKWGFLQPYSLRWPYHSDLFYYHAFPLLLWIQYVTFPILFFLFISLNYLIVVIFLFFILKGLYLHAVTETKLLVDTTRGQTLRINVPLSSFIFFIFLRRKDIVRVTNIVMIIFMCSLISLFLPFDVRYWVLTPLISVESSIMILYVP